MKIITLLVFVCLFISLTGCEFLFMSTYGMKKIKPYSEAEIEGYEQKFKIPKEATYRLDSTYLTLIETVESTSAQNYHYQPLQVLYFDHKDSLMAYYVNCNTGGFPNLKWNRLDSAKNKSLDQFPPPTQTKINTSLSYKALVGILKKTKHTQKQPDKRYKVLLFWNVWMGRQSKRFIQAIQKNTAAHSDSVTIYYINNDGMY